MLQAWLVTLGVVLFARYATRKMKEVPDAAQNFWEWLVEFLYNFLADFMGPSLARRTFWFFATAFIITLFVNWFGLVPGVGTIGWGVPNASGFLDHVTTPLFRGGNADLNMTLAMSCLFFGCWIYWAFKENGAKGVFLHLFGPKGGTKGVIGAVLVGVFFMVGLIEVVSILFRPVSLSLRLYGNIFAGENLLEAMAALNPAFGWLLPLPFYFMELLVGLVQALVFLLLTAVFTLLICTHDEEHHDDHAEEGDGAHGDPHSKDALAH
jgi:F-type H+-transporting ATPase subunit a